MNYPGKELELFDKANFWRKYIFFKTNKFIKGDILEIGAGLGAFAGKVWRIGLMGSGCTDKNVDFCLGALKTVLN